MIDGNGSGSPWPDGNVWSSAGVVLSCVFAACSGDLPPARDLPEFEGRLERLRTELKIPGFSAGIVKDQHLVWARGFGLADVENGVPAAEGTSYHLASVTKTFASTITKGRAWSPAVSNSGRPLPYGFGWFVQRVGGAKLVWHYGFWTANSSLFIKAPERGLAFVILANSDGLSASYPLGAGDLMSSAFGREFVQAFVLGEAPLPGPAIQ